MLGKSGSENISFLTVFILGTGCKMCFQTIIRIVRLRFFATYANFENEDISFLELRRRKNSLKDCNSFHHQRYHGIHRQDSHHSNQTDHMDASDLDTLHVHGNRGCRGNTNHRRASQCSVYAISSFDNEFDFTNDLFYGHDLYFDLYELQGQWEDTQRVLYSRK